MSNAYDIELVLPTRYLEAMRFLAGGARRDMETGARAEAFMQLSRSRRPQDIQLWWARRERQLLAVALVVSNPGRAGVVIFSPPDAPGVEVDALCHVVYTASTQALAGGLVFVQAMLDPNSPQDVQVVCDADFRFLADLTYMRRELSEAITEHSFDEPQWRWQRLGEFDEQRLAEVLNLTYQQSMDCPALSGVRDIQDIIASHKAGGIFNARLWWVVSQGDQPAGCILVNDYPSLDSADVAYLGVTPAFRGRGLAKLMLRRAGRFAFERGLSALTLAVDAVNIYAVRVYTAENFRPTQQRIAYAMLGRTREAKNFSKNGC